MTKNTIRLDGKYTSIADIDRILREDQAISFDENAIKKVADCRTYLERRMEEDTRPHYGINTGFGSLCDVEISESSLAQLQENLVRSHACGMGDPVHKEVVRCIFLLKVINVGFGHSGVRKALFQRMLDLYNDKVFPTMYQLGSLGASGDLAPLAHLAMTLIGEDPNNKDVGLFQLKAKEGLALLNGTQFSLGYGLYNLMRLKKVFALANEIALMSLEAFRCDRSPFTSYIHQIRPHEGQLYVAKTIFDMWEGSAFLEEEKSSVQDPYSFRCIPQVHGATYDAILHAERIFTTELNSVTDNPLIFPEEDAILSGGNFHAQPIAMVIDYLAMAASELSNISERRVYQMINGDRDLPYFLVEDAGLNSGFMIPQYTAASIVNQNKQLTMPTSTDSIISCKGQEDHVSMAANGATKLHRIVDNVVRVLAIEALTAAQALDYRRPLRSSEKVELLHADIRKVVPHYDKDRFMHQDMRAIEDLLIDKIAAMPYV